IGDARDVGERRRLVLLDDYGAMESQLTLAQANFVDDILPRLEAAVSLFVLAFSICFESSKYRVFSGDGNVSNSCEARLKGLFAQHSIAHGLSLSRRAGFLAS